MINKRLLGLLGKEKYKIVVITLLKIVSFGFYIGSTAILCFVLKEIIMEENYGSLFYLLFILPFVIVKLILDRVNASFQANLSNNVEKRLRSELFDRIINNPVEMEKYNAQALSQLSTEGIEQLNLYYTSYLPQFFYSLITPIILFVIFAFISIPSATVFLVCVPLIPGSIIMVSKYAKKIFAIYWDKYLSMGGDFLDNIKGMKELKIFLYDLKRQNEMDENAEEFRKITMKVLVMQLWSTSIMDFVSYAGTAAGLVVALIGLINGGISNVFLAVFVVFVGIEFFMPMRTLGSLFHVSMNGVTAGEKILGVLSQKSFEDGREKLSEISKIEFRDATLKYGENIVVNNLNLIIDKPGIYSFAGNSGSGKSTIIKALNRSIDLETGMLFYNGIDCKEVAQASITNAISFLSYESHIFAKTVKENFLVVNPSLKDEDMKRVLKSVFLDSFDLDFKFSEDASNVSGGEKQRFVLAFYMTLSKKVIVMDEVTSNIDKESEDIIISHIKKLRNDHIIILVSHRLANILDSDCIYFIAGQRIAIEGSYIDVMKNSDFKELMSKQMQMEGEF